jgi:hypothetical protein
LFRKPESVTRWGTTTSLVMAVVLLGVSGAPAQAQESGGSTWATIGGGALGAYSGAVLGGLGGFVPCNQTYAGAKCVWITVGVGGVGGLAAGVAAGNANAEAIEGAALGAGFGFVTGSFVALLIKPHAEGFGFDDVLTVGFAGAAVGSSLPGSALGFGVGAAAGVVFWQLIPDAGPADAFGVALLGMAVGGLATWAARAANREVGQHAALQQAIPIGVTLKF